METEKKQKTWQEYCDEVAKKKGYSNWDEVYCNLSSIDFYGVEKEAAELYNQETAAERDRLKEELKSKNEIYLKAEQHNLELCNEIDSLKEENERLNRIEALNSELTEQLKTALQYMDVFMIRGEEPLVGENLKTDLFNVHSLLSKATSDGYTKAKD